MQIPKDRLAVMEAATPAAEELRARTRAYMATAQLTMPQMAQRINYGRSSLAYFMAGTYISSGFAQTDVQIRKALCDYMDANPVEVETGTHGRLHETGNVAVMRKWFQHCIDRREMVGIYGPPGAQKTFVFEHLVAEHNAREIPKNGHGTRAYYVYCSQDISKRDLLRAMCRAAALPSGRGIQELINTIAHALQSRRALFVLDEAQHLSIPCLEIVRQLNDRKPNVGIILSGSHRLFELFREKAPELEQWNSRIHAFVELPGIAAAEVYAILEAELGPMSMAEMKDFLQDITVTDRFGKKTRSYYSARRLFRTINGLKADPAFASIAAQKEVAA